MFGRLARLGGQQECAAHANEVGLLAQCTGSESQHSNMADPPLRRWCGRGQYSVAVHARARCIA